MASYLNSEQPLPIMLGSPPALVPPRADWDQPPWNRWAFQHVREILPTAEVWRGTGPVRELPRADRDLDHLVVGGVDGKPGPLTNLLDQTYTDGFLVVKDGAIVYERYFNAMGERTLHLAQSVTKSLTGARAGLMTGLGLFDPAAPVTHYLPELNDTAYRGASVQHVLDMTSGVHYEENYVDPHSDVGQTDVASGWKPVPPDTSAGLRWPHHMFEQILGLGSLDRRHGDWFSYRSIETDVLAFCLERATGRRLPQLLSEEIWQKMGAEASADITLDPAGYALASGGLSATLRDYARFGLLYLEGGGGIVPASWIDATRTGNHQIFGEPYTFSSPEGAYRNQWWVEDPRSRALMARGIFGQMIYVNWIDNMVVVKLSSWPTALSIPFLVSVLKASHAIAAALRAP
jgi:CubicO group peptidase (beta-lactamase class C family)